MPWKQSLVKDQRIEFVVRASRPGVNMSALCEEYDISRPTGYRWLSRYREVGSLVALEERSRRPRRSPRRTSAEIEASVAGLRLAYDWGGKKIQHLLAQEGIEIGVATVNRILKRSGLVRPYRSHRRAVKRFEHPSPNQLWQMDFKGPYRLNQGKCYPLSILDDHSRFVVGLYPLTNQLGETVHRCLLTTFERYGIPEAMLMDHGIPWWSTSNGHGLTRISVALLRQGIQLRFSGIRHPQTQGKVERFHRTLHHALWYRGDIPELTDFAAALREIRDVYNKVRPHESLEMDVPQQRYRSSSKAYNPHPPEWEYPHGAEVRRLNSQGCLDWKTGRYFVCEALADDRVQIEEVDNKLVARYRNVYVREIDLSTGRSAALLTPVCNIDV